jgi:hypothetical protein
VGDRGRTPQKNPFENRAEGAPIFTTYTVGSKYPLETGQRRFLKSLSGKDEWVSRTKVARDEHLQEHVWVTWGIASPHPPRKNREPSGRESSVRS